MVTLINEGTEDILAVICFVKLKKRFVEENSQIKNQRIKKSMSQDSGPTLAMVRYTLGGTHIGGQPRTRSGPD